MERRVAVQIAKELFMLVCLSLSWTAVVNAQVDPGPRPGPANAGGPIKGLNAADEKLFWASWERFKRLYSVSGTIERGAGLGPGFNGTGCAQCHAQPAAGGSSPSPHSPQVRQVAMHNSYLSLATEVNPQVTLASLDRARGREQAVPSFITADGPIRVPRFVKNPDGTPDGSTHDIYTIAGRTDAPGCNLPQPDFDREIAAHNVVYRIPTPTFGAGLIESISDDDLIASLDATRPQRQELGIGGRFNKSSNDNTITRFGWKAQNKSLLIFAAESFVVEMGVTSEGFPNKRYLSPGCGFNALPEDRTKVLTAGDSSYEPSAYSSDVVNFAAFMRLSAPPMAVTQTPSELSGKALFSTVGCGLCHTPALSTGSSVFNPMSKVKIEPYSDFALHHMGPGLADGITQGLAGGDEFRTAPLWGVGQRMFFLHDGRTSDLLEAIRDHSSGSGACAPSPSASLHTCASEANSVVSRFNALSKSEQQDLLNFLRSL
jgi:CxxC motif-containing protein (DUF1111 family)